MENTQNQPNQPQPSKPTNKALWVVLIIVILAIAVYGIYAYFSDQENRNTNNTNTTINQNTNVTTNTSTALNTNTTVNTNTVANANTAITTNSSTNTNTVNTTAWKTYQNTTYGFEFKYPENWILKEKTPNGTNSGRIVSLQSPESKKLLEEKKIDQSYSLNVVISYWANINNESARGGSWVGQREYQDLADYFTDVNSPKKKVGETVIDGLQAYEVTIGGAGQNYGMIIEHNGIYEISFERVWDKLQLGSIEKEILTTIKFTK